VTIDLEIFNDFEDKVFIILALYEEVEDLACKWQRVGGENHFMNAIQSNKVEDMVPQPPTVKIVRYNEILANPTSCLGLVV
jgi:hypothetical protein